MMELGLFEDAEAYYLNILDMEEDDYVRARIYNNLAVISELKGEYEKARGYYRQSLDLRQDPVIFENYKRFTGGL